MGISHPGAPETVDQHVTTTVIQFAVLVDDVLRPVQRRAGRRLDRREGAIVQIGLHPRHGRDQLLVADREPDAPARHAVGLGQGGELDRHVLGAGNLQDRDGRFAVVIQLRIGQVADDPQVVGLGEVHDAFIEGQIDRLGRRVGRIVHHQDLGARHGEGHRPLQRLEILLVRRGRHAADRRARDDEAEGVDRIGRIGRQDHVARLGDRGGQAGQTFLRAHGDDHLGLGIDVHAEAAAVIIGLGAAQARNALGLRIAVGVGLPRHLDQLVDHVLGRRQVRVAHAKIDHVLARCACRRSHRIGLGDDIGRQPLHAVEFFGHDWLVVRGSGLRLASQAISAPATARTSAERRFLPRIPTKSPVERTMRAERPSRPLRSGRQTTRACRLATAATAAGSKAAQTARTKGLPSAVTLSR